MLVCRRMPFTPDTSEWHTLVSHHGRDGSVATWSNALCGGQPR